MPDPKLMEEVLRVIYDFWKEGDGPLSPWAVIGDEDVSIQQRVEQALQSKPATVDIRFEGDGPWVQVKFQSTESLVWWHNLSDPIKYAVDATGLAHDFRARRGDASYILNLAKQAGLNCGGYT